MQDTEKMFSTDAPQTPGGFPKGIILEHCSTAKKVTKNWGYELWLVHESGRIAYKMIFLKKGHRTSLQYHEKKEEANFILSGTAVLHYKNEKTGEMGTVDLTPGSVAHVKPPSIHRIEAKTDLLMIETSTPELKDVVRLSDDWNRPDGHIDSEHAA